MAAACAGQVRPPIPAVGLRWDGAQKPNGALSLKIDPGIGLWAIFDICSS